MVRNISSEKRALVQLTKEFVHFSYRELGRKYGISKSTAYNICNRKMKTKSREEKRGRPKVITERTERIILRTFLQLRRKSPSFSIKDLMSESGLEIANYSRRTVSRLLNKRGYKLRQARKKGLLNQNDLTIRKRYAQAMKKTLRDEPNFFTNHIAFNLDGVSFIHKCDPLKAAMQPEARDWRTKGEGLALTAKGSKSLPGGKRLHLVVAIAHGKGVILKEPYHKMDGTFFYNFIKNHFNLCFGKAGPKAGRKRLFVMDNDPSQTSKKAMSALKEIECELHQIPARSPDVNPIENVFHIVKTTLEKEAIDLQIRKESFDEFNNRVLRCFDNLDMSILDRTIESMPKRIEAILASKGKRIKY